MVLSWISVTARGQAKHADDNQKACSMSCVVEHMFSEGVCEVPRLKKFQTCAPKCAPRMWSALWRLQAVGEPPQEI